MSSSKVRSTFLLGSVLLLARTFLISSNQYCKLFNIQTLSRVVRDKEHSAASRSKALSERNERMQKCVSHAFLIHMHKLLTLGYRDFHLSPAMHYSTCDNALRAMGRVLKATLCDLQIETFLSASEYMMFTKILSIFVKHFHAQCIYRWIFKYIFLRKWVAGSNVCSLEDSLISFDRCFFANRRVKLHVSFATARESSIYNMNRINQ